MAQDFFVLHNKLLFVVDLQSVKALCCLEEIIKCVGAALAHGAVAEAK